MLAFCSTMCVYNRHFNPDQTDPVKFVFSSFTRLIRISLNRINAMNAFTL